MEDPTTLRDLAPISLMILMIHYFEFVVRYQTLRISVQDFRFKFLALELGSDLLQLPAQHDVSGQVSLPHSGVKYVIVHPEVVNLLKLTQFCETFAESVLSEHLVSFFENLWRSTMIGAAKFRQFRKFYSFKWETRFSTLFVKNVLEMLFKIKYVNRVE